MLGLGVPLRGDHYGHLAPSFIIDAIHVGAPDYGIVAASKLVPLQA